MKTAGIIAAIVAFLAVIVYLLKRGAAIQQTGTPATSSVTPAGVVEQIKRKVDINLEALTGDQKKQVLDQLLMEAFASQGNGELDDKLKDEVKGAVRKMNPGANTQNLDWTVWSIYPEYTQHKNTTLRYLESMGYKKKGFNPLTGVAGLILHKVSPSAYKGLERANEIAGSLLGL